MDNAGVRRSFAHQSSPRAFRRPAASALAAVCALAVVVGLVSCAPEPTSPPTPPVFAPRVPLASLFVPPAALDQATVPGLFPQRIVPSGAPWVSARWSQLPGQSVFNTQLLGWVHGEVSGFTERTAASFAPRASPAGSGGASRGCVSESTAAPVTQLLADAALAPVAEPGAPVLALNCDVVFASGGWLGMRLRATSTDGAGSLTDTSTTWYAVDGAEGVPAQALIDPAKLGELGEMLLASLGYTQLPTMFAPAAIARDITPAEVEGLEFSRLITDVVPAADGSLAFVIRLSDLPGGGPTLLQRVEWAQDGLLSGGRIAVRVANPGDWLSERGTALMAAAASAAAPSWQPVPAGRQAVDCALVPCIAVTFDDGPGPDSERLLQVLAENSSAASFFLLGSATSGAAAIAAAEATAGHTIANHSWSHPDLTTLTQEELKEQLGSTQRAIAGATGVTPRYMRPPYGALNDAVAAQIPLPIVLWSIDTNDWQGPGEDLLVERVSGAQPGDIILFHDTHAGTVDAMPRVLGELRDRGLELVTLDDLLGERPAGVRIFRQ